LCSPNEGKEEEDDDANDCAPAQGLNPPLGGGDDGGPSGGNDNGDEDPDKEDEDSEMEDANENPVEDPENAGMGKYYEPQTPKGKAMEKMFHRF
jgi:hypothetical protein